MTQTTPTPQAIVDARAKKPGLAVDAPFFAVSAAKLLLLDFCTGGFYQFYWYWKNWKHVQATTGEDISPFWRTFFCVFFCYDLFNRVRKARPDLGSARLPAGPLAAAWIIPSVLWRLPDPYWLVSFLSLFALFPVRRAIDTVNRTVAPDCDSNARFSAWNWVAILIGAPCVLLGLWETFVPIES